MARPKRDPLIAAMIAKLPEAGPWPVEDQAAWLDLMRMTFGLVYGGAVAKSQPVTATEVRAMASKMDARYPFYIDTDGVAKGKAGRPINPRDIKGELFDLRGEHGDMKTIRWADGSTGLNGADLTIVAV